VTLPDGSIKEGLSFQTSPYDIALSISKGLADAVVVAKVNIIV
jgi:threonyl-tRNA synthetase